MQERARLSWTELQDFLAVARAGKLGVAARTIGVDASTIGRRIRRLEQRLGRTLFEQGRDGQTLTDSGEKLLIHVEEMDRAALPIEDMPADGSTLAGTLRISVSEGFGTGFLARHLGEFCAAHPKLTVELVASSGFLSPSRRETDIAIMLARPRTGPVVSRKLSDYTLHLYAAKSYLMGAPPIGEADDLRRHPLIGYVPDLLYAPELRYLGEIDAALEPTIQSSSINAQHRLIASSAGVGVLPDFIGARDETLVQVLPDHAILRSFWTVMHQDNRKLRRVVVFLDWLTLLTDRAALCAAGDVG
ncbi:LysR family transcriptional regulator [Sphingomonas sp. Y38-1Y]|uniref:LysR family transcriptional regulator n=1 Tax=Sphingomonas sp. Y38-1Y TaxID=3078265 RepID=UPI0028EDA41F|nr:LysR family transcriptional regulator [Sphingomonas sp. Y38-1Y]